jgi:hypothetical protein
MEQRRQQRRTTQLAHLAVSNQSVLFAYAGMKYLVKTMQVPDHTARCMLPTLTAIDILVPSHRSTTPRPVLPCWLHAMERIYAPDQLHVLPILMVCDSAATLWQ